MKILKTCLILMSILMIQSCNKRTITPKTDNENVKIRFNNTGEEKIKNFVFNGKNIGNIQAGNQTKYFKFNELKLNDYNMPIVEATAVYNDYNADYYANTDVNTTKYSGIYTINVELYMGCGIGFYMSLQD